MNRKQRFFLVLIAIVLLFTCPAFAGSDIVDDLILKVYDLREKATQEPIERLGEIGDPRAITALKNVLYDEKRTNPRRMHAAISLGKIGAPAMDILLEASEKNEVPLKGFAARGLGEIDHEKAYQEILKTLDHEDRIMRHYAIMALKHRSEKGIVNVLIEMLDDEYEMNREFAVRALASKNDSRVVDVLTRMLDDESESVREATIYHLGDIGNKKAFKPLIEHSFEKQQDAPKKQQYTSSSYYTVYTTENYYIEEAVKKIEPDDIGFLVAKVNHSNGNTRKKAASLLKILKIPNSVALLLNMLFDIANDVVVKKTIIDILQHIDNKEASDGLVKYFVKEEDDEIRTSILEALNEMKTEKPLIPFKDMLVDRLISSEDRKHVIRMLVSQNVNLVKAETIEILSNKNEDVEIKKVLIDSLSPTDDPEIVSTLEKIYFSGSVQLKWSVAKKMGSFKNSLSVKLLGNILGDKNYKVRKRAYESLSEIGTTEAIELFKTLGDDREQHVRAAAYKSLGKVDNPLTLEMLKNGKMDKKGYVRKNVVRALGQKDTHEAKDVLMTMIDDDDEIVRQALVGALGRFEREEEVLEILRKMLDDKEASVRDAAFHALTDLKDLKSVGLLMKIAEGSTDMTKNLALLSMLSSCEEISEWKKRNENIVKLKQEKSQRKALKLAEETLELTIKDFGEKSLFSTMQMDIMAIFYIKEGEYQRAENLSNQSLDIKEELFGKKSPHMIQTYSVLASLYAAQERYDESKDALKEVEKISRKMGKARKPFKAMIDTEMANLYILQEKYDEAEKLLKKVNNSIRKTSGEDHLSTAQSYYSLASLYFLKKDYASSEKYTNKAIDIFKNKVGEKHPIIADSLDNLMMCLLVQKKYEEAEDLLKETLNIRKETLGDTHYEVAINLNKIGEFYRFRGNNQKAEDYLQKAVSMVEDHPEGGNVYLNEKSIVFYCTLYSSNQEALKDIIPGLDVT